jgi:hypothetical protein
VKRFRVLNVILILLIALAIWRTVDVWRRTPPAIPDHADAPGPVPEAAVAPARRPALPQLVSTITDKDLFDVSRQAPAVAAGPAPEQTPSPPPTLKLSGVIVIGEYREAVFIDSSQNNKQIRVPLGEEISGYKVTDIDPTDPDKQKVKLVNGSGDEVKLELLIDSTKGAGAKPVGPGGMVPPPPHPGRPVQGQLAGANAPGGFGPPGGAAGATQRNDARDRAQRARDRLKRLRDEAATNK